jgi:hypothetical protein
MEKQTSTFKLTNRQWAHETGRLSSREKTNRLHRSLSLQCSIDVLSKSTSRTTSRTLYLKHVSARVVTAHVFGQLMNIKATSRWKFETYQKEQRAVEKLSTDLLGGMSPTNTLVVWGNGSFGSTSKGHDSAPNKTLRHMLSRFVPIVMNSEYNTPQVELLPPHDRYETVDQWLCSTWNSSEMPRLFNTPRSRRECCSQHPAHFQSPARTYRRNTKLISTTSVFTKFIGTTVN